MRVAVLSVLALGACINENDFKHIPKAGEGSDSGSGDDTDEGGGDDDACPDQSWDAEPTSIDESCETAGEVGTFTPVIEWTASIGDAYTAPVVGRIYDQNRDGSITEDDIPAVVVANAAGEIIALAGDTGSELWSVSGLGLAPMTPAIGDLDGDGEPEIVGSGAFATLAVSGEGATLWSASGVPDGQCGAVGIGDLDGDGLAEVVLGSVILNGADGSTLGRGSEGSGTGFPGGTYAAMGVVADLDQDGVQEAVVGNAAYDVGGSTLWANGRSDGFVAIGNFDGDDYGEMVVSGSGSVRLQDDDGTILWSGDYTGRASGPPTIADFDGDGEPEIGVAGMSEYIVLEADGSERWSQRTDDSSSGYTGSSVFDFEGDGEAEVVYADEQSLFVFDGATGAVKLIEEDHSSPTCSEYPAIADVDNDGHAEIVYTSAAYTGSQNGVRVVGDADDSWMAGRPVWNQHAYSITNVEDDLSILAYPESNWTAGYNNFRSGDVTLAEGVGLPDLQVQILDVCPLDCAEGRFTLWVALANGGTLGVEDDVNLEIRAITDAGDISVWNHAYHDGLEAGMRSASIEVDLESVPTPVYGFIAIVNGDAAVNDCHDENDENTWEESFCL